MKCFSFIESKILKGIPDIYSNTLDTPTIAEASVRFYLSDANGGLVAKAAQSRYEDLFLYGYTELIPDNGPGNLFPEDSYLLDLDLSKFIPEQSTQFMKIQTAEQRILLGCIKESVIATTEGIITWDKNKPVVNVAELSEENLIVPDNTLVLEL